MKDNANSQRQSLEAVMKRRDSKAAELRPEVIERARRLLEDPDYPNIGVARSLARNLLTIL